MSQFSHRSWILFLGTAAAIAFTGIAVDGAGQIGQLKSKLPAQPQAPIKPVSSIPGPRTVQLDLETFQCFSTDELGVTGGDEPYLAVRTYWIDGNTVKLDQLTQATFRKKDGTWAQENLGRTNVKGDQAFGIPNRVGSFEDVLIPIPPGGSSASGAPAMVGVAVIAMEQDFSSKDASGLFITDAFKKFDEEILRSIRTRTGVDKNRLSESLNGFLSTKWTSLFHHNFLGAADGDDVIGTSFRIYSVPEIEAAGLKGVEIGMGFYRGGLLRKGEYHVRGVVRLKSTPPPPRKDVVLTITHVRQVDDLEGFGRGDPDFQARVVMDGQVFMSSEKSGETIRPNWTFRVPMHKPETPISIELYERDGGSPDELCDISQVRGRKTLLLRYIADKDVVSGDRRGKGGVEIVASGVGDSDRAEIGFTVAAKRYGQ